LLLAFICRGGFFFVLKTAAVLAFFSLLFFSNIAKAQLLQSANAYVGGAYADSVDVINRETFRGWDASFEDMPFHRRPYLGFVLDGSGIYRKGIDQYTAVLGPRVSKNYGKWRIFVDVMGGGPQTRSSGNIFRAVAEDGGVGVDRKLPFKHFSWRLQFDYVHTHFLSANQNDFRGSTGLVWRF
jgi:hypothetical protein